MPKGEEVVEQFRIGNDGRIVIIRGPDKKLRWRAIGRNGRTISESKRGYHRRAGLDHGLGVLRRILDATQK